MTASPMLRTPRESPSPFLPSGQSFDIVGAFAVLDTERKMSLFDQLMANRMNAWRNGIHALWPLASDDDARKLEMTLRHRLEKLRRFS